MLFPPSSCSLAAAAIAGALAVGCTAADAQRQGRIRCEVTDNGAPASGTMIVRVGQREVARGTCGTAIAVPRGSYRVEVSLDGAFDGPSQQMSIDVHGDATARAAFETGDLEVEARNQGRPIAAVVTIERDGRRVGQSAAGVSMHLSTGPYTVVVRYRAVEQRRTVVVTRAGQQVVTIEFAG